MFLNTLKLYGAAREETKFQRCEDIGEAWQACVTNFF